MAEVTRRDAVRLVAAGAAVAVGVSTAAAKDKLAPQGKVTAYSRIKIASKNILGREAALWFIEEEGKFYIELTYRNKAAKVEIADGEQEIANFYGVKFKLKVSDIHRDGDVLEFRVRLIADPPIGGDITIIDEVVRINVTAIKADVEDAKKPAVLFGAVK